MKTVTSEDNLSGYFLAQKRTGEVIDIVKLNRKIKSIKAALKLAEQHNEDLHGKIKNMKENHQLEIVQLETECRKYKQLYQILTQNYQLRGLELKEYKKRLKKVEAEQARTAAQFNFEDAEEITKEYRETIVKQERDLGRLRQQNRALYEQIYEKASKIKDYEQVISKSYNTPGKADTKDKLFLLNVRTALESKNDQFDKILHEKVQLTSSKTMLEKECAELQLKIAKLNTQLQFQRKNGSEIKERLIKQQKQLVRLQQQLKSVTSKYSQLLSFSYEIQKDFEKELHVMGKELFRKEIIRT